MGYDEAHMNSSRSKKEKKTISESAPTPTEICYSYRLMKGLGWMWLDKGVNLIKIRSFGPFPLVAM